MEQEQALLARIIDLFAQRFDKRAVLRGGMVLRILGSPRYTNDLHYVFVPYRSKNDIVEDILDCLGQIEGAALTHSLHLKCLRVVIATAEATVQVEAKVAREIAVAPVTTRLFSTPFGLPGRLINVVDLSVALAEKMAAWNDRRLIRDLYDIWFYLRMNVRPDLKVLHARLIKPQYSKLLKIEKHFPGDTPSEFFDFLRGKCAALTDEHIAEELSSYLPPDELDGLSLMFRVAFAKLGDHV